MHRRNCLDLISTRVHGSCMVHLAYLDIFSLHLIIGLNVFLVYWTWDGAMML